MTTKTIYNLPGMMNMYKLFKLFMRKVLLKGYRTPDETAAPQEDCLKFDNGLCYKDKSRKNGATSKNCLKSKTLRGLKKFDVI